MATTDLPTLTPEFDSLAPANPMDHQGLHGHRHQRGDGFALAVQPVCARPRYVMGRP